MTGSLKYKSITKRSFNGKCVKMKHITRIKTTYGQHALQSILFQNQPSGGEASRFENEFREVGCGGNPFAESDGNAEEGEDEEDEEEEEDDAGNDVSDSDDGYRNGEKAE